MLTKINYDGTWSCKGINFEDLNGNAYGALCKLRDYEKSGFEPDDLDRIRENIHIGSIIQNYTVISVYENEHCLAEKTNSQVHMLYGTLILIDAESIQATIAKTIAFVNKKLSHLANKKVSQL